MTPRKDEGHQSLVLRVAVSRAAMREQEGDADMSNPRLACVIGAEISRLTHG